MFRAKKVKRYIAISVVETHTNSTLLLHVTQHTTFPHAQRIYIFLNSQNRILYFTDAVQYVMSTPLCPISHSCLNMSKDAFRHYCEGVENALNQLCHNSQGSVKDATVSQTPAMKGTLSQSLCSASLSVTHYD